MSIIYEFPPRYSAGQKVFVKSDDYCGYFGIIQRVYYYYPDGWKYFLLLQDGDSFEVEGELPVKEENLELA